MKFKNIAWCSSILLVLLNLAGPGAARGEELVVEHNPASGHFGSIQEAITAAASRLVATPTANFSIRVKADPTAYSGSFTPISNVPIFGDSTAGTFLTGGGTAPLINLSSVSSVQIRNFTFLSASTAISVANSSVDITNNVFKLGTAGTAIRVQNSPSATIVNNTFFNNGTAISSDSDLKITNNIFASNNAAISTQLSPTQLTYNDFFANKVNGVASLEAHSIPSPQVPLADPLFVNAADGDFHLQSGSPCIGSGNPNFTNSFNLSSDMGAYGGPKSDIPSPTAVTGLTSRLSAPDAITLSWSQASSSKVTAYRVYYGTASGNYNGTQAREGKSPIAVTAGTTQVLSGLPVGPTSAPLAPQNVGLTPLDKTTLQITWTPVAGATGYRISYGTDPASLSNSFEVDGAGTSSAPIPGLITGTTYFATVTALARVKFFMAVTAVIDANLTSNPGSANESPFSPELSQGIGDSLSSAPSLTVSDFPEAVAPFPNLKSEGCFIATAAYGFYSAPQVQALRDFRDLFLLTNAPGRAFVAWYYHYGPRGAHFINVHPWLKAPVRAALFPLIAGALVLTSNSPVAKTAVFVLAILWLALLRQRRKPFYRLRPQQKKFLLTLLLVILPSLAQGGEIRPDRPHWSLELKGGAFFPEMANWSKFYGSGYLGEYGAALAYKPVRQFEVGLAGSFLSASGKGQLPGHTAAGAPVQGGDVTLERAPLDAFVLARAVFSEEQWLVPYAGGGYTRLFFREEAKGQGTTRGSVNGYHARAGLQLVLDGLEPTTSRNLYLDYGVHHTSLFLEAKYLHAQADTAPSGSVNLGGTSCLGGFLFEF